MWIIKFGFIVWVTEANQDPAYALWRQRFFDGGRRSHSLRDFFAAQKPFVCFKEAPKQTLCSLWTLDMLDITREGGGEAEMESGHTFLRFF